MKIKKRGAPPLGGGQIIFKCPSIRALKPCQLTDPGKINRIRGIAYCTRVSPQIANRVASTSKQDLTDFTPNVFVYTDRAKGVESGLSPGYGLTLVAETTTGCLISAEDIGMGGELPEDLAKRTIAKFLKELEDETCVDASNQGTMLFFMALCPEDVSKIQIGRLTTNSILMLRHLKAFFGVTFKIKEDTSDGYKTYLSCVGAGYSNFAKNIS
eukprot:TRINITY_DN9034_c0_g1_i1.p1 TRINITY_DN9034_c0_g1~~TRINITY_DN9034_c0_g1_i1.p1  ORF type:complete len:213 (-),score=49.10 TRINITY_DN9034_c0_g1_i1:135-773(-)